MAINNDIRNFLKTRYLKDALNAIPDLGKLQEMAKFEGGSKLGEKISVPVILRRPGGYTVAAPGAGVTLNTSAGFGSGKAEFGAFQHIIEERITMSDIAAAASSEQAYQILEDNVLMPSIMSFKSRLEHYLLNGGLVGKIGAGGVSGTGPWTLTIDAAFFAEAIWAGCELTNKVDIHSAMVGGTTRGTSYGIDSIDFDTRQVVVSTTTGGVLPVAGDFIFWEGTRGIVTPSVRDQLMNVSGTMLNIPAASFPLWRPTQHVIATTGVLNFNEAMKAVAKGVGRGGLSQDCWLLCATSTEQNLSTDQAALRSFDASYKSDKAETGFGGVRYKTASGFTVEPVGHPLLFPGEAYIIPKGAYKRYGSVEMMVGDPSFSGKDQEPYYPIPGTNYLGYKQFSEQTGAILTPAQCIRITNASGTAI